MENRNIYNEHEFVCETNASFEYENALINTCEDPNYYEIFEKVASITKFLNYIIIPQTIHYIKRKSHVYSAGLEEIRAYFDMNLVMGYHVLPSMRCYWSSGLDLSVPFIAHVILKKRLKKIRSLLLTNYNESMRVPRGPLHDREFKFKLVLDHFTESFASDYLI